MIVKRLMLLFCGMLALVNISSAATLLPQGEQTFLDGNGAPLSGGQVFFYSPGTTTPKSTFKDPAGTLLNTNPVVLDGAGRATIYGSGSYREVVNDANGNLIWDQLTADTSAGSSSYGGTSTGSANAQIVASGNFTGQDGQSITFLAGFTNTGGLSVTPAGGSPIPVLKDLASGPANLTGSEVVLGNSVTIVYDQTRGAFHLVSVPFPTSISVPGSITAGTSLNGATLNVAGLGTFGSINVTGIAAAATGNFTTSNTSTANVVNLNVSGTSTLNVLNESGLATFSGGLTTTTLGVTGNATLSGTTTTVSGTLSAAGITASGNIGTQASINTGSAAFTVPYTGTGAIVVPVGIPIRANNTNSAWGAIGPTGTVLSGFNVASATNTGAGTYNVTFSTALANANYAAVVSASTPGANSYSCMASSKSTAGFVVSCWQNNPTTGFTNSSFDFHVSGGE